MKAFLRRSQVKVAIAAEIAALKEDAKAAMPKQSRITDCALRIVKPQGAGSGIMLEVSIPDLHMGKLSWAKETGYSNYDSVIAAQLFQDAVASIIARNKAHQPEEICFVVGNDLLNADNLQGTTTRGTPQHCDVRYQKTFLTTRRMIAQAVKDLRELAPVRVIMVPGNHDQLSCWHLGDSLECFFNGANGITVDNGPTQRKYYEFGDVMLLWTHGDKAALNKLPLLMATEQREMFGRCAFHEAHVGHRHQVELREMNGVRVRTLPSLTAADAWHSEMAFVGNVRSAEAYLWHRKEGLIGTSIYTAPDSDYRAIARPKKAA